MCVEGKCGKMKAENKGQLDVTEIDMKGADVSEDVGNLVKWKLRTRKGDRK